MIKVLKVVLIMFLFFSCEKNRNDIITYYSNNKVKQKYHVNDQNNIHGEYLEFYNNGILKVKTT